MNDIVIFETDTKRAKRRRRICCISLSRIIRFLMATSVPVHFVFVVFAAGRGEVDAG